MLISKFANMIDESTIINFENYYNIKLCDQYKKFLLIYNGGYTVKTEFTINNINSDLSYFYGLDNDDINLDLKTTYQKYSAYKNKYMLPIGINKYGDFLLLNVSTIDNGKIYFSYHDSLDKEIELCSSFKEFISTATSEKIQSIKTIEERKKSLIEKGKSENITENLIKIWENEINFYTKINQEKVIL